MGQTTRSKGISFTHEKWTRIDERCKQLKCGRSQYFQMLVESDLRFLPDTHPHKADNKWHFFPEMPLPSFEPLRVAEPGSDSGRPDTPPGKRKGR